ncbi:MAG TPA: spermidine synthase [Marisediminicola sp.]|jgi:spermidine synthase|nr:spermidine synthase [Marisediminicola sp.]
MGEISLRRRHEPTVGVDVFEAKLGDEFLMSSLFTVAEIELARLGLAEVAGEALRVLVGGLGLGYTAQAVLEDSRVESLIVVEALGAVISWHERRLLPVSAALVADERTRLVEDDFFDLMRRDPRSQDSFDAILVDIDHSPRHLLNSSHADLYTVEGLRRVRRRLAPGGVFALWSDDPPDAEFEALLAGVFPVCASRVVTFDNALTRGESANTVYVARIDPTA